MYVQSRCTLMHAFKTDWNASKSWYSFCTKTYNVIPESESSHAQLKKIIHHISGYFYFCNKKLNSTAKLGGKTPFQESTAFLKILQECKERIIWKHIALISISSPKYMSVASQYVNNFFQWALIYFSSTFHLPTPTHSPAHM